MSVSPAEENSATPGGVAEWEYITVDRWSQKVNFPTELNNAGRRCPVIRPQLEALTVLSMVWLPPDPAADQRAYVTGVLVMVESIEVSTCSPNLTLFAEVKVLGEAHIPVVDAGLAQEVALGCRYVPRAGCVKQAGLRRWNLAVRVLCRGYCSPAYSWRAATGFVNALDIAAR